MKKGFETSKLKIGKKNPVGPEVWILSNADKCQNIQNMCLEQTCSFL